MSDLRDAVIAVDSAGADVQDASRTLLTLERVGASSMSHVHDALIVLGEALQRATQAHRQLARVLALDPDLLAADEPLVPPLLEGTVEC